MPPAWVRDRSATNRSYAAGNHEAHEEHESGFKGFFVLIVPFVVNLSSSSLPKLVQDSDPRRSADIDDGGPVHEHFDRGTGRFDNRVEEKPAVAGHGVLRLVADDVVAVREVRLEEGNRQLELRR